MPPTRWRRYQDRDGDDGQRVAGDVQLKSLTASTKRRSQPPFNYGVPPSGPWCQGRTERFPLAASVLPARFCSSRQSASTSRPGRSRATRPLTERDTAPRPTAPLFAGPSQPTRRQSRYAPCCSTKHSSATRRRALRGPTSSAGVPMGSPRPWSRRSPCSYSRTPWSHGYLDKRWSPGCGRLRPQLEKLQTRWRKDIILRASSGRPAALCEHDGYHDAAGRAQRVHRIGTNPR